MAIISMMDTRVTNIKYNDLVSLKNNSELIPGRQYRITDYNTTTVQSDTQSANHVFDIIVTADSTNKLNENARAIQHTTDSTDYFYNSKLNAWILKYTIDNDTTKYAWADSTNGKGVIYYLKDEFNNECGYDFKNIMYARYKITARTDNEKPNDLVNGYYGTRSYSYPSGYTISTTNDNTRYYYTFGGYCNYDGSSDTGDYSLNNGISVSNKYCYNNEIYPLYDNGNNTIPSRLNNIVFLNEINSNHYCYNNICKSRNHSNTFGNNCYSNTFGNNCYYNIFGNSCYSNTFENDCKRNIFGDNCNCNIFWNDCHNNIFNDNCNRNTFGNYCNYNTFRNNCNSNTFGNDCDYNTFGNYCGSNSFGNDCDYNTFGNRCHSNTFENCCYSNSFWNNCDYNSFWTCCSNNTFENANNLKEYKITMHKVSSTINWIEDVDTNGYSYVSGVEDVTYMFSTDNNDTKSYHITIIMNGTNLNGNDMVITLVDNNYTATDGLIEISNISGNYPNKAINSIYLKAIVTYTYKGNTIVMKDQNTL